VSSLNPLSWQAESAALATVWVKGFDAEGQYSAKKGVDLRQSVDDFKASWAAEVQAGRHPSRFSLHLVDFTGDEPTAAEEASAKVLQPRLTLAAAGVTDGCSLLASIASTAAALPGECVEELRAHSLLWQPCERFVHCA
jgi:hypothetical protein